MVKTKQTKSSQDQHRRTHCSLDALPPKLRRVVEKMIVNNEWPKDFKKHYKGTPRHCDISAYCKRKGYRFSSSAVGRFAAKIQSISTQKIAGSFRSYARAHLGTLCLVYANIQSDLELTTIDSSRRELLEEQQEKNIDRIEQLITSLKELDNNFPNLRQGG